MGCSGSKLWSTLKSPTKATIGGGKGEMLASDIFAGGWIGLVTTGNTNMQSDPLDLFGDQKAEVAKEQAKEQKIALAKQEAIVAAQEKQVADEQAKADAAQQERTARLGKGRTGLLYGDAGGVQSNTKLGG